MSGEIILRRQIIDELAQLKTRETELVARLRKLDEATDSQQESDEVSQGITNACRVKGSGTHWESDGCSYCGSMRVSLAIELLKTPGTDYSGADWKYGWPHKFYIGGRKFYNNHLEDATPEELVEFSKLSEELLGISWDIGEKGVRWKAVPGTQKWGVVGATKLEGEK
jgi:hypothetical protein